MDEIPRERWKDALRRHDRLVEAAEEHALKPTQDVRLLVVRGVDQALRQP